MDKIELRPLIEDVADNRIDAQAAVRDIVSRVLR